jgi:hypothetical protein
MGKFIGLIIIVLGLFGSYRLFQEFTATQKAKSNRWISKLQPLIKVHLKEEDQENIEDPTYSAEGNFFRILAMMNEAERGGYSAGGTLAAAISGSGAPKGEAKMIEQQTLENYELAKKLDVFKDPKNGMRMEQGQPPIAGAPGWDDEPLVVGHILTPLVAPEAAKALTNLMLMPLSVRNMENGDLSGFTREMAMKWGREHLITAATAAAVAEKLDAK